MRIAMTDWFDQVYNDPLYLKFYEGSDSGLAIAEARSAIALLDPDPDTYWLDLCCGFGRHAEQFAQAGYRTTGVDRSGMMLSRARQRACAADLPIDYVQADLRQLPFSETFDRASCMFDSFGYFGSDIDHLEALLSICSALKPHGRLLIELSNRERILSSWNPESSESYPPYQLQKRRCFDLAAGRVVCDIAITGPEGTHSWTLDCRMFAASELRNLLEQAGFDQIQFYGDWDASPLSPQSRAMIVLARKCTFADLTPLFD